MTHGPVLPVLALHCPPQAFSVTHGGVSDWSNHFVYIESKVRASSAVRNLWEQTRDRARKERKTPVLMLFDKGKPGALIVVHQDDLAAALAELAAQSGTSPAN